MESVSLVIVLLAALMIPLLMARLHITNVPTAVAEIITGILLGPSLLNVVPTNAALNQLSSLGVIVLIFLSGMEIDFSLFGRQKDSSQQPGPVSIALLAYASVIGMALVASLLLQATGLFSHPVFATIVFATVALGVVIAALKEKELLSKPFGQTMLLIAALGEVVPLLALTIYSAVVHPTDKSIWLLLLIFVAAIVLLLRFRRPYQWFAQIDKSTTQLDIRLAFFLIVTLVTVAAQVGAESILGAFLAGIVMKLLHPREETRDKLTSIGYGFFIPIFFIMTGVKINLRTLLADPASLGLIPLLLLGFLLAKVLLWPILRRRFQPRNAIAGTFLISTTITLVVPAVTVGRNLGIVTSQQAGAFTLAAVITCLGAPILFNTFYVQEKEDYQKTVVHFIGTNILTVPIAQQLTKGFYDITLYTDDATRYKTYNSETNVRFLDEFTAAKLQAADAFQADIVVLGYFDHDKNYQLAQWAITAKVPRIIARFENKDIQSSEYDELTAQGVEIFNTLEANISLLRALIESPATVRILSDTTAGIYEIVVRNRRFTGMQLKNLPFIDEITVSQIYRDHEFIAPHGDTQIQLGDHIIFTGDKEAVGDIRQQVELLN
ncbi:cation:proton antiporter [Schleiferilactobacillus harbinensis]|uniref:cation:proton antiporter domain-containing protein n=1 Tax=Schleiferilactobacillus harbinensis TaxID=304207 RepID=UPI0039E9EE99